MQYILWGAYALCWVLLIFWIARVNWVVSIRMRAVSAIEAEIKARIRAGGDYEINEYAYHLDSPSQTEMVFQLRKWTFKQFYPKLKEKK